MYNNPFNYGMSTPNFTGIRRGLFNLSRINWGTLLSNTQKTLGIINQTIPIIYQIKPIVSNAKTMFKIASSLKSSSSDNNDKKISNNSNNNDGNNNSLERVISNGDDKPIFFI